MRWGWGLSLNGMLFYKLVRINMQMYSRNLSSERGMSINTPLKRHHCLYWFFQMTRSVSIWCTSSRQKVYFTCPFEWKDVAFKVGLWFWFFHMIHSMHRPPVPTFPIFISFQLSSGEKMPLLKCVSVKIRKEDHPWRKYKSYWRNSKKKGKVGMRVLISGIIFKWNNFL